MTISLKLLAIALISCLAASSVNDIIVPEGVVAEDEMEVFAENNHVQEATPDHSLEALTVEVLAKELDRDKTTKALCSEANNAMLDLIKTIKDPKQREKSRKNLEECKNDPEQADALARTETAVKEQMEAAQNKDSLKYKTFPDAQTEQRAQKVRAESNAELEQQSQVLVEDEDPQAHAELVQMHSEFQDIITKYNVDTSQARKRGPEEHNRLVTGFVLDAFAGDAFAGDALVQDSSEHLVTERVQGAKLVGKCLQGIMAAAPVDFCWKDTAYHQFEQPQCPSGWHRPWGYLECLENCRPGYYFVSGGTCYEKCNGDDGHPGQWTKSGRRLLGPNKSYRDDGATCWKAVDDVFWKHHYWAERRGNCGLSCRPDQYMNGCMCYQKCSTVSETPGSMENCGTLACSAGRGSCKSQVVNTVMDIGFSIASIASLVMTAGVTAPAVLAAKKVLTQIPAAVVKKIASAAAKGLIKAGKEAFQATAVKLAMNNIKDGLRKDALKKALDAAKTKAKTGLSNAATHAKEGLFTYQGIRNAGIEGLTQNMVKAVCNKVAFGYWKKLRSGTLHDRDFDPKNLDPSGLAIAGTKCVAAAEDPSAANDLSCASGTLAALNTFDPTGLLGVAAVFMHGKCTQPTPEDLGPMPIITRAPSPPTETLRKMNGANWFKTNRRRAPANAPVPTKAPTTKVPTKAPISGAQARANLRRAAQDRRRSADASRRRTGPAVHSSMTIKLKGTGSNAVENFFCSNHAEDVGMSWSSAQCGQYGDWKLYFDGNFDGSQGRTVFLKSTLNNKWLCSNMVKGMSWADPVNWKYCQPGSPKYAWKLYWIGDDSSWSLDSGTTIFLQQTDGGKEYLQSSAAEGAAPTWSQTQDFGATFKIFF